MNTNERNGTKGEFLAAAELSGRGYRVCRADTKGVDLFVMSPEGRFFGVQVKTAVHEHWRLTKADEENISEQLFYIFVGLRKEGPHTFRVVRSEEVAREIRAFHAHYLATPGKRRAKRKDTSMRQFEDPNEVHADRWSVLPK